jgi:hypothetical protein
MHVNLDHPLVAKIRHDERRFKMIKKTFWIGQLPILVTAIIINTIESLVIGAILLISLLILMFHVYYSFIRLVAWEEPVYIAMLIAAGGDKPSILRKDKCLAEHVDRFNRIAIGTWECLECRMTFNGAVEHCYHQYDFHRKVRNIEKIERRFQDSDTR